MGDIRHDKEGVIIHLVIVKGHCHGAWSANRGVWANAYANVQVVDFGTEVCEIEINYPDNPSHSPGL